jgi:hypothetical protein
VAYVQQDSQSSGVQQWDFYQAQVDIGVGAGTVWQTNSAYLISKFRFGLDQYGGVSGNIIGKVYNSSAQNTTGIPSGSALASSQDFDVSTLVTDSYTLVDFVLSSAPSLISGSWYCIAIETSTIGGFVGNNLHKVRIWVGNEATFHGFSAPAGVWTSYANNEKPQFVTYSGDEAPPVNEVGISSLPMMGCGWG